MAILATVFTLANALWAAWDQGLTYDEPFHLRWAQRLLSERNDARDAFRFDSKTPALLPAVLMEKALRSLGVDSEQALRFATRLPSIAALMAVLLLVAQLARSSSPATWWAGLLVAALDPNLAANASIATTDVFYSLVVLAFVLAAIGERSSRKQAALLGAVLGLAFSVKFTAVLLVPIAAMLIVTRRGESVGSRGASLALAAISACIVMDIAYLGVGVFVPLGSLALESPMLKAVGSAMSGLLLPIPRSVVTGIDASIAHNTPDLWASYIFGAEHRGGVWYYFIAHWLMKTPVALVALVSFGSWRVLRQARDPRVAVPAVILTVHLVYFSFLFATQIGLRFALPCIALACALAARGLTGVPAKWIVLASLLAVGERAPYLADPIAFTNLSVWPKSRAYLYTADSNLDYGQNRERLERYAKATGEALVLDQPVMTPGLFVLGANELTIFDTRRVHRWLIEHDVPAINVGYTDFAFSITGERFDEYMTDARSVEPEPDDRNDTRCGAPLPHYAPGAQIPFEQVTSPEGGRLWLVCVKSRKGADVGFTATDGRLYFGRVTSKGVCDADLLQKGQQSWYRVPGGVGVRLCLREVPYRRTELAYVASGYVTIRGQGADAEIRSAPVGLLELNEPAAPSARER